MPDDQIFQEFINKLKQDKKTDEEVGKFLANLLKFSAAELYFTILTQLTEEDMAEIDKIEDDQVAQELVKVRFKERTGVTPEEFVTQLKDKIAKGYLFPELHKTA